MPRPPRAPAPRSPAWRPTLVLLDLYLPDGHGLDLLRETLEHRGQRPDFLVITAARDMTSVRRGDAARRPSTTWSSRSASPSSRSA